MAIQQSSSKNPQRIHPSIRAIKKTKWRQRQPRNQLREINSDEKSFPKWYKKKQVAELLRDLLSRRIDTRIFPPGGEFPPLNCVNFDALHQPDVAIFWSILKDGANAIKLQKSAIHCNHLQAFSNPRRNFRPFSTISPRPLPPPLPPPFSLPASPSWRWNVPNRSSIYRIWNGIHAEDRNRILAGADGKNRAKRNRSAVKNRRDASHLCKF